MAIKELYVRYKSYFRLIFRVIIILLILLLLLLIPLITEYIITNGWYRPNSFKNDIWFSFMGSYLGAIITVIIFCFTILLNRIDIKAEINRNRKNVEIEHELEIAGKIYRFFLLTDYALQDPQTELMGLRRLLEDIIVIRCYIDRVKYEDEFMDDLGKSKKEFYDLVKTERFLLGYNIAKNMSQLYTEEDSKKYSQTIMEIIKNRNDIAGELTDRYEKYVSQLIKQFR